MITLLCRVDGEIVGGIESSTSIRLCRACLAAFGALVLDAAAMITSRDRK